VCAAGVCGQKLALVGGTNWHLVPTPTAAGVSRRCGPSIIWHI